MEKKKYPNPFELYMNVVKYNMKTLDNLIRMNDFFSDLAQKRNTVLNDSNINIESIDINDNKKSLREFVKCIETDNEIDTLFFNNYPTSSNPQQESVEDFEVMTKGSMENRPISLFEELSEEKALRLNLFGVHTIGDFEKHDLSEISHRTGIPENELNTFKSHIQKYLP